MLLPKMQATDRQLNEVRPHWAECGKWQKARWERNVHKVPCANQETGKNTLEVLCIVSGQRHECPI